MSYTSLIWNTYRHKKVFSSETVTVSSQPTICDTVTWGAHTWDSGHDYITPGGYVSEWTSAHIYTVHEEVILDEIGYGKVTWDYTQYQLMGILCNGVKNVLDDDILPPTSTEWVINEEIPLLVHEDVFRNPNMSLTSKIQMMHMQSCNQIAHSGDKWEERGKEEDEKKKKKEKNNRDTKTFGWQKAVKAH